MSNNYDNLITVKFAQAEQPKFEERRGKGYIEFGMNNNYPDYLLNLYNESPKHGAIIKGKAKYIFGEGFKDVTVKANTKGETWNQILKKSVLDDELFSGYYLQIIYNLLGKVKDIYHIEFYKVRTNKEQSEFYVKNDWQDNKEKVRCYPAFDGKYNKENPSQILFVKQYNPKSDVYPLPSYFQGLNYIESDVQVSRHILGNAKDGFVATTLINLNNGEPAEEQKGAVEKGLKKKFTGSEGDRVVIMFNSSKDNAAEILPLSTTMLTKEDFTNVNNLIQQEVFACHQITSPALFGISTPGALGQRNEIRDAYEIFNNTYVNERQVQHNEVFNQLFKMVGITEEYAIIPVEPIKFEFGEAILSQNLTKDEIRKMAGKEPLDPSIKSQAQIISDNINALSPLVANKVLESMTPDEIRSLAGLIPTVAGTTVTGDGSMPPPPSVTNNALTNMTGKQFQHLDRIKRKFTSGKLTRAEAAMMLKNSFGLSDTDISILLDGDSSDQQFASQEEIDFELIEGFKTVGESVELFEILSEKPARESEYFADVKELSQLESNVINLIKKDKRVTPDVLAKVLKQPVEVINKTLQGLTDAGIIAETVTPDAIERTASITGVDVPRATTTDLLLRYKYSGPQDSKNRPFCAKLLELNKLYSRSDIEDLSIHLGYSVWDRRGGWFTQPDGEHRPYCRHSWSALTVIRKK